MRDGERRPRVLTLLTGLPTENDPIPWVHVYWQMREISKACSIILVVPRSTFYPFEKREEDQGPVAESAFSEEGFVVYQPRYFDLPRFVGNLLKRLHLTRGDPGWAYFLKEIPIYLAILTLVLKKRIRVDLIHAHYAYWPAYVGSLLSRSLRKKLVVSIHGSDLLLSDRADMNQQMRWRRIRKALFVAHTIVAVSQRMAEQIGRLGNGLTEKVAIIPTGFRSDHFFPMEKQTCRTRLGWREDKKYVLFIGNFTPEKGPDLIVEAFRIVSRTQKNLHLVLVGDGDLRDELKATVARYGLRDSIEFAGPKHNAEVPIYVSASDLVVVPSRYEGRGVVVLEALACGKPVVAFNVGGIAETLSSRTLGILVPPEDVAGLAAAIVDALQEEWRSRDLREAVGRYSQHRIAERFVGLYKQILSGREVGATAVGSPRFSCKDTTSL